MEGEEGSKDGGAGSEGRRRPRPAGPELPELQRAEDSASHTWGPSGSASCRPGPGLVPPPSSSWLLPLEPYAELGPDPRAAHMEFSMGPWVLRRPRQFLSFNRLVVSSAGSVFSGPSALGDPLSGDWGQLSIRDVVRPF